jgi:hypothetical protein
MKQKKVTGEQLALRVLEYFGDKAIEPFLDSDIEVRDMALQVLGRPKAGSGRVEQSGPSGSVAPGKE